MRGAARLLKSHMSPSTDIRLKKFDYLVDVEPPLVR
jgi:hypothetical protein